MAHINSERSGSQPTETIEETIRLNESEEQDGFLIREESTIVNIYPSRSGQKLSTSKLKIRNLVDYGWDSTDGCGRLISTHISGKYIAYVVKVANVGAVRVVDLPTNERVLLKGTKGLIKDVEFLHKPNDLVVGFIDEYGTFYIYKITKDIKTNKLQTFLILNVELEGSPNRIDVRRFVWCKYVPDEDNEIETVRDCAFHFAVLQNNMVYVSNLIQLVQKFGEGKHSLPSMRGYYMTIDTHTDSVYDASFAPDGTALATACRDGTVKFFQVYIMGDDAPRCLYSWSPHNGQPVSRILFLDDHSLNSSADCQYWKYMITAGQNQSEVMLWTCKTWKCLQTLRFTSPLPSQLRMELDLGAHFLVMSDLKRKVMFVLNLEHDDDTARFVWINEFSLPTCLLSFNVSEGAILPLGDVLATHEATQLEEFDRNTEIDKSQPLCLIGLYFIQAKSLQQGKVIFKPPSVMSEINCRSPSRISFHRSISYNDDKVSSVETCHTQQENQDGNDEEGQDTIMGSLLPTKSTMNIGSSSKSGLASPIRSRRSTSPSCEERVSPRIAQPSVTQMTQQLSNLMGLVSDGGVSGNTRGSSIGSVERSCSNKSPDMIQLHTPSPYGVHMNENISIPSDVRPRTSSVNGNGSNASSSPSREVEEILSPKNTDLIGRRSQTSESMEGVMNNLDVEGNVIFGVGDLPLMNKTRQITSPKAKTLSGNDINPQLPQVLEQMSSILDMMKTQAVEVKELKREVSRMNAVQALTPQQMDENSFARILDKYFTNSQLHMRRIEESLSTVQSQEKQKISQTQVFTPNLPDILAEKLGRVLKSEIELRVLPNVMKLFEPTRTILQNETLKLINTAEGRIKQEMKQILQGQNFKDSLTPGIEKTMSSILEGVVAQIFRSTIIPNFEKSLQSMFVKINDTFMKGTKEYICGLEATMDMRRSQQDTSQDVLKQQFVSLQDSLGTSLQVELETQLLRGISSLQVGLLKQVEETMARELNRAFGEQQRYLEVSVVPRTATPAVSVTEQSASRPGLDVATVKKQVFHLLDSGDITAAFVQAARFGDGPTILELAEKVHPAKVFTPTLPIQTSMSLIQLFVSDIHINTDTKLQYLHTALGVLNLSQDKRLAASLARIIPIFQLSAKTFLSSYPDSHHIGNLKILEMAFLGHAGHSQLSVLSPQNNSRDRERQKNVSSQQLFGLLKPE